MRNMPGSVTYGVLILMALLSLGTIGYGIQARAQELIYYSELSKQQTVHDSSVALCGGPTNVTCDQGFTCHTTKTGNGVYGICRATSK